MKKIGISLFKVLIGILVWILGALAFFVRKEGANPRFLGTSAVIKKIAFKYFDIYPDMMVEPFISEELSVDNGDVSLYSGMKMEIRGNANYDLVIDPSDVALKMWPKDFQEANIAISWFSDDFTSTVIELRFKNTSMKINGVWPYNPEYRSLMDPYQMIDGRLLWFWYFTNGFYYGDFCIALYDNAIIHTSWREILPDCHILVLPNRVYGYLYTKLKIWVRPAEEDQPSNLEVLYHTILQA